ncbi:MAG TPA: SLBB domain-containing protein [Rhizomicrobium sp.]
MGVDEDFAPSIRCRLLVGLGAQESYHILISLFSVEVLRGRSRRVRTSEGHMLSTGYARLMRRSLSARILRAALFVVTAVFLRLETAADAQQSSQSTSLQQILSQLPNAQSNGGNPLNGIGGISTNAPVDQTQQQQQPLTLLPDTAGPPLPVSRLERILSSRAGANLQQFGYSQVGVSRAVRVPQAGALQDNYILGPGDEVIVAFRGQENSEYRFSVDRSGQIVLPRLSPILAAGRPLGDVRRDIQNAVHRGYVSTQVFVSLGQLRQVSVVVSGEVNNPGVRIVTGQSTPLDAILLSGGIKKTGTLRNIKLVHAGRTTVIDLYGYLTQAGRGSLATLSDGDRIIVPPLGATVAISGWVRQPAIYELSPFERSISVQRLVKLAGGTEVRGQYRLSAIRTGRDGSNIIVPVSDSSILNDSDVLVVQLGADQVQNRAVLSGGTPLAGIYSVGKSTTLADVLRAPGAMGSAPYTLFGLISRRGPNQMRVPISFTPAAVLNGSENLALSSHDIVRVFSADEVRLLTAVAAAFRNRQNRSEAALLTPEAVLADFGATQSQSSTPTINPSTGQPIATEQNPQPIQPLDQDTLNQKNGVISDRENIAELSTMVMGDGGVLVQNPLLFAPGTAPPALQGTPSANIQTQQSTAAAQQQQRQAVLQALGTQGAIQYQATQQLLQSNGVSGSPIQSSENSTDYSLANNPDLPQNLQQQSVRAGTVPSNQEVQTFGELARQLDIDPLVLIDFLLDNQATVSGAVHGAGTYFVGDHATLNDLVTAAGGMDRLADQSAVEVISTSVDRARGTAKTERQMLPLQGAALDSYIVKPHDEFRFSKIYTTVGAGSVNIRGQVRDPGTYPIERGERLSELLLRAGGLTEVAYPYGTVFLRKSAAQIERQGYERMADELQNVILAGMTRIGSGAISPNVFTSVQGFIAELKATPPLGRISIIADPALLATDPSRDPLLEPGDVVYIPQRPSTVTVLGQVMQQGSFSFDPKKSPEDYVAEAGGEGEFADSSLTFLILPDGTAKRVESSWLSLNRESVPPGSTIVVPRESTILDTRQILFDTLGVLQNLAVSAASLAVISRS